MFNRVARWALLGLVAFASACAQPAPSFEEAGEGESVAVKGRVIRLIADDFEPGHAHSSVEYVLETHEGTRIALSLGALSAPLSQRNVLIEGVRKGRVLEVLRADVEPDALGVTEQPLIAEGTRRLAILLFNFQKDTETPFAGEAAQKLIFGAAPSSTTYFAEQSFGRLRLGGRDSDVGEVYGWHTIAADPAECNPQLWQQQARAIATAKDGVDFAKYDHIIMYFPTAESCPWAGLAESPGKLVWIQGAALNSSVFEHEFLHNLGIHHANVLRCQSSDGKTTAANGKCSEEAYADPFDPMGYGGGIPPMHTNGKNKAFLGWISKQSVAYVTSSAEYTLNPIEAKSEGLQVLAIPLPNKRFYWLDFRQRIGSDSTNYKAGAPIVNGVGVRVGNDLDAYGTTGLVDTLPSTKAVDDSAITVGKTYVDAENGVRITTLGITDGVAKVRVQIGDDPVPPAEPADPVDPAEPSAPDSDDDLTSTPTDGDPVLDDDSDDGSPGDESSDPGVTIGSPSGDDLEVDAGAIDLDADGQATPTRAATVTGGMGCQVTAGRSDSASMSVCLALACLALLRTTLLRTTRHRATRRASVRGS